MRLMVRDIRYLPSAYNTQVEFRSHFSGKKVRLMVREIWYSVILIVQPTTEVHRWGNKSDLSEEWWVGYTFHLLGEKAEVYNDCVWVSLLVGEGKLLSSPCCNQLWALPSGCFGLFP